MHRMVLKFKSNAINTPWFVVITSNPKAYGVVFNSKCFAIDTNHEIVSKAVLPLTQYNSTNYFYMFLGDT